MKKLGLIVALLCACPAWATFSQTQVKSVNNCSASPCNIVVTSTGAGHSGIIATMATNNVTISSATGCSTAYTMPAGTLRQGNATTGFTDMGYCLSLSGGSTTISITTSGAPGATVAVFWEVSSGAAITFDVASGQLDATCTSCALPTPSLSGSNDFIAALASCGGTCSAVTNYTADLAFPNGDGTAHLLNTAAATASNWTMTSSTNATAVLALKDASGGGGVVRHRAWVIQSQ